MKLLFKRAPKCKCRPRFLNSSPFQFSLSPLQVVSSAGSPREQCALKSRSRPPCWRAESASKPDAGVSTLWYSSAALVRAAPHVRVEDKVSGRPSEVQGNERVKEFNTNVCFFNLNFKGPCWSSLNRSLLSWCEPVYYDR